MLPGKHSSGFCSRLALNPLIGNTTGGSNAPQTNLGQSFINDPVGGSGATIYLNSWVFDFNSFANATIATGLTLNIYEAPGIGTAGTLRSCLRKYKYSSFFVAIGKV